MRTTSLLVCTSLIFVAGAYADTTTITVNAVSTAGVGESVGTVTVMDTQYGAVFKPALSSLNPGMHGFHVHQNPSCDAAVKDGNTVAGLAAGGHFDPANTGVHAGPYGEGHLGDLPGLYVDADGNARTPVLAPRVRVADVKGRSLMIHEGGDNYSDQPKALGGGGARMACGVFD